MQDYIVLLKTNEGEDRSCYDTFSEANQVFNLLKTYGNDGMYVAMHKAVNMTYALGNVLYEHYFPGNEMP